MSNRYCNLNGDNPVNQEYPLITDGFDDVQLEMDAEVAKVASHVAGTADKHNASNIVNDSDVSGEEVKAALNTLKGLYDNMSIGASNTAIGVFSANAAGTNTLTSTIAGIAAYFGGLKANLTIANTNTGAVTWNLNSLGAKAIKILGADGTKYDLTGGEMTIGSKVQLEYDGTDMIAINIQKASNSTAVTVTQPITTLPSTSMPGLLETTLSGNTLVNALTNPDFANGTTGWSASGSTQSVLNKINTVTGSGTSVNVQIFQQLATVYQANKKVKAGCRRVRVTNADCVYIRLFIVGATSRATLGSFSIVSPVQNQWYGLSDVISLAGGTVGEKIEIYFRTNYTDAATATGKVMEIDGNFGVHAIDLGTSASDLNYNKTNAELDNMIGGVLQNGINGVSGLRILSTGKNRFDAFNPTGWYKSTASVDYSVSSSKIVITTVGAGGILKLVLVKQNTDYYIKSTQTSGAVRIYDSAQLTILSTGNATFNTGANTSVLVYCRLVGAGTGEFTEIILVEGSVAPTYEPYVSSTQDTNKTMYSLPNGVKDRTYWQDGKRYFEQDIMPYTLVSGDMTNYVTTAVNYDYITLVSTNFSNHTTWVNAINRDVVINGFSESANDGIDGLTKVGSFATSSNNISIYMFVAKGTFADVAAARIALTGTQILYQLATPIITELEGTERLIARPDGSIVISPTIKFESKPTTGVITKPADMSLITAVESVRKITMNSDGTISYTPVTPASFTTTTITLPAGYDDTKFYEVVCSHTSQNCVTPNLTYSYPTNVRGEIDGMISWVNSLDKNLGELNDFTVAYLLNIEARLTAHSI